MDGQKLTEHLLATAPWNQKIVQMCDKQVLTPRLSAWYADSDTFDYTTLMRSTPNLWTPQLLRLKALIKPIAGVQSYSVLLNYYRDGNDSVAWHSDNERSLGTHPMIASVCLLKILLITTCYDLC